MDHARRHSAPVGRPPERHHADRAEGNSLDALLPPGEAVSRRLSESRQDFLRFFRRRLSRPEDAEDALQDFCMKAIRAAASLDHAERVDAWLGRILRNTLTDHYRRRAAWRKAEAAYQREPHVAAFHPEDEPLDQMCLCMHRAIPSLKPDYAEILSRADLNEESRDRIAADLGLTANNVGVRLHRARQALKTKLEEICGGCRDSGCFRCDCPAEDEPCDRTRHDEGWRPALNR